MEPSPGQRSRLPWGQSGCGKVIASGNTAPVGGAITRLEVAVPPAVVVALPELVPDARAKLDAATVKLVVAVAAT